ncbi:hypothetical protein FD31_GL000879 [Companilactobacillus nantensis DSM 16982]|uniref:Uncharacterized protein n=1 Tax=Companilactobacillus nantensis DSM 16982 TaxID=1423774 RepID=A0A0R1WE39_9LACO|nr:hypothetical protein FD31_GL000879 [Companilactobacillus nantensis DSM 16982]
MNVSDRTISSDIKDLNAIGKCNGYEIKTVRKKGYLLQVTDQEKFTKYLHQITNSNASLTDIRQRILNLEIILLLAGDFITLKDLSQKFHVSVSTVKDDLKRANQFFKEKKLQIVGKPHYGIYVQGKESNKRQAIIDLFRMQLSAPVMTPEYTTFTQMIKEDELRKVIQTSLEKNNLVINDLLLKNVIEHVRLLIFRLLKKNYISISDYDINLKGDVKAEALVRDIVNYIENTYNLEIPDFEITYLKTQMIGKLSYVEVEEEAHLKKMIDQALKTVDETYRTEFRADKELQDFLLIHVATLFKRLSTNHQLTNPLIDDVYVKYANVINASLDFMNYLNKDLTYKLSKDELGYVAIYFAASLERQKLMEMENYQDIVVLTQDGRGAGYLLETGISRLFPKAKIKTISMNQVNKVDKKDDLVISTICIPDDTFDIPIIQIDPILSNDNLNKVEKSVRLLNENPYRFVDETQSVLRLFSSTNFNLSFETDYLDILKKRGLKLEQNGQAKIGYKDSVFERELKISTVYDAGIAGPHPMTNVANQEIIDVTILKEPIEYQNKKVQIIFLINIGQGHLTLHQEISRMMIELMKDSDLRNSIIRVKNYKEFIYKITTAIKRS